MLYTPLRYPGGKGRLAPYIKLLIRTNGLLDGHYVEPYAGGAGIALALLFHEYATHIHINDLSRPLYAFWHSVLFDTDKFCKIIEETPVTIDSWKEQKKQYTNANCISLLELGFATFFLNRTNRSGILNGGVIGGKAQQGPWKIDARYNKQGLIGRIRKIGQYRNRISIYQQDASLFIQTVLPALPRKTLIYFDPPYYTKGQDLYQNYYKHQDHQEIAELLPSITQSWIVSYDNRPEVNALYHRFRSINYDLNYSAAQKYQGEEVIFFAPNLVIPTVLSPIYLQPITMATDHTENY